jgi:Ca2+/Na+ antiporter
VHCSAAFLQLLELKPSSIAVCLIAFNALLLGLPVTIIADLYDPTTGAFVTGATMMLVTVTGSIIPYVYLRRTKTLPDWLVELQVWTALLCTFSLALFVHQGSSTIVNTCVALLGVILRVRAWPLVVLLAVAFNVLHTLINEFPDYLPKLHETFYTPMLLSARIMYLSGSNITPCYV